MTEDKPLVLISYSEQDKSWLKRLRPHLEVLAEYGHVDVWDEGRIAYGEERYREFDTNMQRAAIAVCLISADYLSSDFIRKEEVYHLLDRRQRESLLIIPVYLRTCAYKAVPWLKQLQPIPLDWKSIDSHFQGKEDDVFAELANHILEVVSDPDYKPPAPPEPPGSPPDKIDIERLPPTGFELFGRQKELKLLDKAWESEQTNVVSLVAYGGVGKSTLVSKWLKRLSTDNYRGAERVYAWSFYSQGTKEQATSADFFFNEALQWFGEADPARLSLWEKGERLAELIRGQKTLLILDGMEPLQSGFDFERGKIKDPALEMLISRLAQQIDGLCVITTRVGISGLPQAESLLQRDLEQISPQAARALLRVGGVRGSDQELEEASRQFGPHALAIQLLASYLQDIAGHPISAALQIPDLDIPEGKGKHPRRVIAAFEQRFGEGSELELLRILGLFDRPAKSDEVQAVRTGPPIAGLTSYLHELNDSDWAGTVEALRQYRLLAPKSRHRPNDLDAHPLLREHFAEDLQESLPEAWREGHRRLYEHLKQIAKELPDTLEGMMPLYQAVAHGCRAGLHQQALDKVYWARIQRKSDAYAVKKLGAFGADLAAVSNFFERPWERPSGNLTEADQALALGLAGFHLRALGRLSEALEPLQVDLKMRIAQQGWSNAATVAGNLSELHLTLGNLPQAVDDARHSLELADRSGDAFLMMSSRIWKADALHQCGDLAQARSLFQQAEQMQKEWQPQYPLLYSLRGFRYCDLLLGGCEALAWTSSAPQP
ncbi:MAG: TIR domain-containing protein, partial [Acidobacteriota bacterium]